MKLLQKLRTAEVKVGASKKKAAWYRGQSSASWSLAPRLLRSGHGKEYLYRAENAAFADFRSSASRYLQTDGMRDSWDFLCAMQHFGVATRLLDWTTEFEIALYFAIAGIRRLEVTMPEAWPCIWVLNPYRLNYIYANDDVIFDRADPIPFDFYTATVASIKEAKPWPHDTPIAINPGFSNRRVEAQHGRFTVHGDNLAPLECGRNPATEFWGLERVVIDPNDWGELKNNSVRRPAAHLRIYPDIEGYVRSLNQEMKV
jgi:hypothetical protein